MWNHLRQSVIILAGLIVVAGCSTTELSTEGSMVRAVDADWANKCRFLGVIEVHHTTGLSAQEDRIGAMNETRNQVAAKGGDAYTVSTDQARLDSHLIQADAYDCSGGSTDFQKHIDEIFETPPDYQRWWD